jgi:hypothetical protein
VRTQTIGPAAASPAPSAGVNVNPTHPPAAAAWESIPSPMLSIITASRFELHSPSLTLAQPACPDTAADMPCNTQTVHLVSSTHTAHKGDKTYRCSCWICPTMDTHSVQACGPAQQAHEERRVPEKHPGYSSPLIQNLFYKPCPPWRHTMTHSTKECQAATALPKDAPRPPGIVLQSPPKSPLNYT